MGGPSTTTGPGPTGTGAPDAIRAAGRARGTRPLRSSPVAIEKPFLACHSTSHQPSLQPTTWTRLPPGILATISLLVPAAVRRFSVDGTNAGSAAAAAAVSTVQA